MLIKTQTGDLINLAHVIAIRSVYLHNNGKDTPFVEVYAQTVDGDEHTLKKIRYDAEFTRDEYGRVELDEIECARQEEAAAALIEDILNAYESGYKIFRVVSKP